MTTCLATVSSDLTSAKLTPGPYSSTAWKSSHKTLFTRGMFLQTAHRNCQDSAPVMHGLQDDTDPSRYC